MRIRSLAFFALLCLLPIQIFAQAGGTGLYTFGSFDNRGFDTVNIGNLNVHFEVPIVNKPGRGLPFQYSLVYDGLIWSAGAASGTSAWTPDPEWGIHAQLFDRVMGYISYEYKTEKCIITPPRSTMTPRLSNYVYHDGFGRQHAFKYFLDICDNKQGNEPPPFAWPAIDGSGYTFDGSALLDRHGNAINVPTVAPGVAPPPNAASLTDTNGNYISFNGSGVFTDTTGTTALTVGGNGTAVSPRTFTYPVTRQADSSPIATATLSYATYTVQTNFGCSGVSEYGPTTTDLPSQITLADGTAYHFTYESTPGVGGAVTGRLASITLPTGGTISYSYSGGCNGTGMNANGSIGNLSRTTSDGTRTYTTSSTGTNTASTTVQDEVGHHFVYNFVIVGSYYPTHETVYDGDTSAPILLDQSTCYNGASVPCTTTSPTLPITAIQKLSSYNGGAASQTKETYDATMGVLLTHADYDYGGALLQTTTNTYNSLGLVTRTTITDAAGNPVSDIMRGYDEQGVATTSGIPQHLAVSGARGNNTSTDYWVNTLGPLSSGGLNNIQSYLQSLSDGTYDTGVSSGTSDWNGDTQFSYDATQSFLTQVTPRTPSSGVSLTSYTSYDASTGVQLSASDANFPTTPQVNYSQYDRLLRPAQVNTVDGGIAIYQHNTYQGSQTLDVYGANNSHKSFLYDGYGRLSRAAVYNGQAQNAWYVTDYCYDATGALQFSTTSQGIGFDAAKLCSGSGTTYSYDALGRVTNINTPDGSTSYQYFSRATKKTDMNGVQLISQIDGLGRTTIICEISSNPLQGDSPQACGTDITGTGYTTTYAYDLANHKTTLTQGVQQRIFQTDSIGRTIYTKEPERGETSYSYAYNSIGLVVTRTRPRANQGSAAAKTNTVTQYDSVGRIASIDYDDGTPSKHFFFDVAPSSTQWNLNPTNTKGRLVDMISGSGTSLAMTRFSYDQLGRVTQMRQCGPSICGTADQDSRPALQFLYDLEGNLTSEFDGASGQIAYGRSPAGEVTSITNLSYTDTANTPQLVSNVVNSPNGPVSYTLGNGLNVYRTYDNSGRPLALWVCRGAAEPNCSPQVFGADSFKSGQRVTSIDDTVITAHTTYDYDEFNRLSATHIGFWSGAQQNFSYGYDRYGNRWSQDAPQGGLTTSYAFNKSTNQNSGMSYDAAGNVINDGFHSYSYDADGNITQVDNGTTAQYVYDALNRRVHVQTSASTYEYVFDYAGRRISSWLEPSNFGNQGRIYWDGQQIAYRAYDGTTYFDHQDVLGTERMRTDHTGAIASEYASGPWGDGYVANLQENPTGNGQDNLHFAGLDHDSESGTEHAQFRQYSSIQGRWMSPDPYDGSYDMTDPQSLNRYSYVGNMPLSSLDPLGLYMLAPCDNQHLQNCLQAPGVPSQIPTTNGVGTIHGGSNNTKNATSNPAPCKNGLGTGGAGVGAGYNVDAGVGAAGASSTGGVGAGAFHNSSSGNSGGLFGSGGATAYAGSNIAGAPTQTSSTFTLGAYAGAGANFFFTNAGSANQLRGPFTTVSVNVGVGVANLGVQLSFGGGIWQLSITPPLASVGVGAAGSVVTTNTIATHKGC